MEQRKFSDLGAAYDRARATTREVQVTIESGLYLSDRHSVEVRSGGLMFRDMVADVVLSRRTELAEDAYNRAIFREAQAREDLLAALQDAGAEYASTVTLDGKLFDVAAQLQTPVRDGDVIDKQSRTILVGAKLAWRVEGWNGLTREGQRVLAEAERRLEGIPATHEEAVANWPDDRVPSFRAPEGLELDLDLKPGRLEPMTAHFQATADLDGLGRHEATWPEVQAEAAKVVQLSTPVRENEWTPNPLDAVSRTVTEDEPSFWLHRRVTVRDLNEDGTVIRARVLSGIVWLDVRLDSGGAWQGLSGHVAVPKEATRIVPRPLPLANHPNNWKGWTVKTKGLDFGDVQGVVVGAWWSPERPEALLDIAMEDGTLLAECVRAAEVELMAAPHAD